MLPNTLLPASSLTGTQNVDPDQKDTREPSEQGIISRSGLQALQDRASVTDPSLISGAQVTQCSLQALVSNLAECELTTIQEQFVSALFRTWELLCTVKELLSASIKRFEAAYPSPDQLTLLPLNSFLRCEVRETLPMLSAFLPHNVRCLCTAQQYDISRPSRCKCSVLFNQRNLLVVGNWFGNRETPDRGDLSRLTNGIPNWVKENVLVETEPKTRGFVIEGLNSLRRGIKNIPPKKGETSRKPDEKLINWEKYAPIASIINGCLDEIYYQRRKYLESGIPAQKSRPFLHLLFNLKGQWIKYSA
ncbi:Uncharacterized protein HZ326_11572 [Fusarium oxysporum f. sp. albedinis]|nr:Uncharacterized protein HZ326_11572 [Fusarium oxysporum f. sp. albedinis]